MSNPILIGLVCLIGATVVHCNDAVLDESYMTSIPLNCPAEGVFGYPHPKACDEYFQCTNGTLTHEYCPNGLLFSQTGHVVGFCAYQFNVDCQGRTVPKPVSTPGCPYQFGFFSEDDRVQCNVYYSECSWGVPERRQCEPHGLFFDQRINGCNWPDKVGCSSEGVLNFQCPPEDKGNRYWPYPRYPYTQQSIITCVSGLPRLVSCGPDELVDEHSLTCQSIHKDEEVIEPARGKFRRF